MKKAIIFTVLCAFVASMTLYANPNSDKKKKAEQQKAVLDMKKDQAKSKLTKEKAEEARLKREVSQAKTAQEKQQAQSQLTQVSTACMYWESEINNLTYQIGVCVTEINQSQ